MLSNFTVSICGITINCLNFSTPFSTDMIATYVVTLPDMQLQKIYTDKGEKRIKKNRRFFQK